MNYSNVESTDNKIWKNDFIMIRFQKCNIHIWMDIHIENKQFYYLVYHSTFEMNNTMILNSKYYSMELYNSSSLIGINNQIKNNKNIHISISNGRQTTIERSLF